MVLTILATLIEGFFWFEYDYGLDDKKSAADKTQDVVLRKSLQTNGQVNGGFHHHPSDKLSKELDVSISFGRTFQIDCFAVTTAALSGWSLQHF